MTAPMLGDVWICDCGHDPGPEHDGLGCTRCVCDRSTTAAEATADRAVNGLLVELTELRAILGDVCDHLPHVRYGGRCACSATSVQHDHTSFVPGCFRCDLSRDER